jgi:hypothetical protein
VRTREDAESRNRSPVTADRRFRCASLLCVACAVALVSRRGRPPRAALLLNGLQGVPLESLGDNQIHVALDGWMKIEEDWLEVRSSERICLPGARLHGRACCVMHDAW